VLIAIFEVRVLLIAIFEVRGFPDMRFRGLFDIYQSQMVRGDLCKQWLLIQTIRSNNAIGRSEFVFL